VDQSGPSINDEVGLLVDGFKYPAAFMSRITCHITSRLSNMRLRQDRRYAGMEIRSRETLTPNSSVLPILMRERGGITIRNLDMKNFDRDVEAY